MVVIEDQHLDREITILAQKEMGRLLLGLVLIALCQGQKFIRNRSDVSR